MMISRGETLSVTLAITPITRTSPGRSPWRQRAPDVRCTSVQLNPGSMTQVLFAQPIRKKIEKALLRTSSEHLLAPTVARRDKFLVTGPRS